MKMTSFWRIYFFGLYCLLSFVVFNGAALAEPEKTFYPDGKIKTEILTQADGSQMTRSYAPNGGLVSEKILKDGKIINRTFDPDKVGPGELLSSTRSFFKDGALYRKVTFKGDKLEQIQEFDPDGELLFSKTPQDLTKEEADFKSGAKDGTFQVYQPSGDMHEMIYEKGRVISEKFYDPAGRPKQS